MFTAQWFKLLLMDTPTVGWVAAFYHSVQFPLLGLMSAIFFGCIASLNFIWKLKDEVYQNPEYHKTVAAMQDIDATARPLVGFEQLRRFVFTTMVVALTSAIAQVAIGSIQALWSSLICLLIATASIAMIAYLCWLLHVTSQYASHLASKKADADVHDLRSKRVKIQH